MTTGVYKIPYKGDAQELANYVLDNFQKIGLNKLIRELIMKIKSLVKHIGLLLIYHKNIKIYLKRV